MHQAARRWVERLAALAPGAIILDVGGRNINGTVRDVFEGAASYTAIDLIAGPGVDLACDFLHYRDAPLCDIVLHLEVAEHTPDWRDHIAHAADLLRPDGRFVLTAAGPDRLPHSGIDGGALQDGEHYQNVDPIELGAVLDEHFSSRVVQSGIGEVAALRPGGTTGDVYALARR